MPALAICISKSRGAYVVKAVGTVFARAYPTEDEFFTDTFIAHRQVLTFKKGHMEIPMIVHLNHFPEEASVFLETP